MEKFPYPVKKTKLAPWTEKLSQGNGSIISDSTKQKVNSRSSTEAELIGADAEISEMLRTKRFIEQQEDHVMRLAFAVPTMTSPTTTFSSSPMTSSTSTTTTTTTTPNLKGS